MANMNRIPPGFSNSREDEISESVLSNFLVELLRDLTLNRNLFSMPLEDEDEKEILAAYGYSIYKTSVRGDDIGEGSVSVALPSSLSNSEVEDILRSLKTYDDALMYFPKFVLDRENRKLYVKLIKKLINDCNS